MRIRIKFNDYVSISLSHRPVSRSQIFPNYIEFRGGFHRPFLMLFSRLTINQPDPLGG